MIGTHDQTVETSYPLANGFILCVRQLTDCPKHPAEGLSITLLIRTIFPLYPILYTLQHYLPDLAPSQAGKS